MAENHIKDFKNYGKWKFGEWVIRGKEGLNRKNPEGRSVAWWSLALWDTISGSSTRHGWGFLMVGVGRWINLVHEMWLQATLVTAGKSCEGHWVLFHSFPLTRWLAMPVMLKVHSLCSQSRDVPCRPVASGKSEPLPFSATVIWDCLLS